MLYADMWKKKVGRLPLLRKECVRLMPEKL